MKLNHRIKAIQLATMLSMELGLNLDSCAKAEAIRVAEKGSKWEKLMLGFLRAVLRQGEGGTLRLTALAYEFGPCHDPSLPQAHS